MLALCLTRGKKWIAPLCGAVTAVAGMILALLARSGAVAPGAEAASTIPFSLGLILTVCGIVITIGGCLPKAKPVPVKTLSMAALFAALCYVGFSLFRIDIPVGDSSTAFHLGNVFCVLAALFLGGTWGGMAGAVGMTIADLMIPAYITSAPKTFLLKLGIGLITGFVAHKIFRISQERTRKIPMAAATAISCAAGMVFNVIADPLVGYFYKMYVLAIPQEAATVWAKMGAVTTAVNALVAVIAATVFYLALRPALKRTKLMPQL